MYQLKKKYLYSLFFITLSITKTTSMNNWGQHLLRYGIAVLNQSEIMSLNNESISPEFSNLTGIRYGQKYILGDVKKMTFFNDEALQESINNLISNGRYTDSSQIFGADILRQFNRDNRLEAIRRRSKEILDTNKRIRNIVPFSKIDPMQVYTPKEINKIPLYAKNEDILSGFLTSRDANTPISGAEILQYLSTQHDIENRLKKASQIVSQEQEEARKFQKQQKELDLKQKKIEIDTKKVTTLQNNKTKNQKELEEEQRKTNEENSKLRQNEILKKAQEQRVTNKQLIDLQTAKEKAKWENIAKFFTTQDMYKYMAGVVTAVIFIYFLAKYGIAYLFRKKQPELITSCSLPLSGWGRLKWRLGYRAVPKPKERVAKFFIADTKLKKQALQQIKNVRGKLKKNKKRVKQGKKVIPYTNALFSGPPGTGKSMLATIIAQECGLHSINLDGNVFAKMPIEDRVKACYEFFSFLNFYASEETPIVVFMDEVEAMGGDRTNNPQHSQVLSVMLSNIPKPFSTKVKFMGATNLPSSLDSAFRSRFNIDIKFTLPSAPTCYQTLARYLTRELQSSGVTLSFDIKAKKQELGETLEGLAQRDIEGLIVELVGRCDMEEKPLAYDDLMEYIGQVKDKNERIAINANG